MSKVYLGFNDTCALFRCFTEVSTWQRTFLCPLPGESSKQTFVSKLKMKSAAPCGVCNKLLLKLVSPCKRPQLDAPAACPRWISLCLIQRFHLCNVLRDVGRTRVWFLLPCTVLWGRYLMEGLLSQGVQEKGAVGAWCLVLIPTLPRPLFSISLFRNKYDFWYLWSRFAVVFIPISYC